MSRPQQAIITQALHEQYTYEVIESQGLWAILYQGQPVNIRRVDDEKLLPVRKYLKTVYPNPGYAHLAARKLNKMFMTEDFKVEKIL